MRNLERIVKCILLEARSDFAIKQYGSKVEQSMKIDQSASRFETPEELIQYLNDKVSELYVVWVTKMYALSQFKIEDCTRLKNDIDKFIKFKNRIANKDLNSYKTLKDLYDATREFEETDATSKNDEIRKVKSDIIEVFKSPSVNVIIPKTEEASCLYGKNTKWCTAAEKSQNQFSSYSAQGHLYIFMVNLEGKNRKFQLHLETESFMDEDDSPVSKKDINALSKIEDYKNALNEIIKREYTKYID